MKQESSSAVRNNTLSSNILLQKNIDYPYIEIRDDIAGTGIVAIGGAVGSFISASANDFVTLYKPDTSYIRTVKFGGESVEYNKKSDILLFDLSATTFQSFGYKSYTNTGSYTTANLLANPSFESDVTGWTASAMTGTAP